LDALDAVDDEASLGVRIEEIAVSARCGRARGFMTAFHDLAR